jgi:hypothetical protein
MKPCTICKRSLPLAEFNRKAAARDGLQDVCRECNRAQARRYYAENREKHLGVIAARTKAAKRAAKDFIGQYLMMHSCVDCGEEDVRVLEFDHRPGVEKTAEVMRLVALGYGLNRVAAEMAKCDVRCPNCHARVTYERSGTSWRQRWRSIQLGAWENSNYR